MHLAQKACTLLASGSSTTARCTFLSTLGAEQKLPLVMGCRGFGLEGLFPRPEIMGHLISCRQTDQKTDKGNYKMMRERRDKTRKIFLGEGGWKTIGQFSSAKTLTLQDASVLSWDQHQFQSSNFLGNKTFAHNMGNDAVKRSYPHVHFPLVAPSARHCARAKAAPSKA